MLESGTSGSGPSSGNGDEVEADDIRQRGDAKLGVDQRLQPVEFFLRFIPGPSHHRHHAGHDLERIRRAPAPGDAGLQVGIERLCRRELLLHREQNLCRPRRQLAAGVRLPGLHNHRLALRRAGNHQRSAHRKMLALVMQHVQLGRMEEQALRLVHDEGVVLPGVPEALRHLDELGGAAIAVIVRRMLVVAEVERLRSRRRRHHVPADAALAHLVERREHPRHMERIEIGGRRRRDQADVACHRRKRAEQRQRLDPHRHRGALPHLGVVGAERRVAVGVKDEVEQRALGGLGDFDVLAQVRVGVRSHARIAPGRDVMSGSGEEKAKLHHG